MAERVSDEMLALVAASDVYGSVDLMAPGSDEHYATLAAWDIDRVCAELLAYRQAARALAHTEVQWVARGRAADKDRFWAAFDALRALVQADAQEPTT